MSQTDPQLGSGETISPQSSCISFRLAHGCVAFITPSISQLGYTPDSVVGSPPTFCNLSAFSHESPEIDCRHSDGSIVKALASRTASDESCIWTLSLPGPQEAKEAPGTPGTPATLGKSLKKKNSLSINILMPTDRDSDSEPQGETLCHVCDRVVPICLFPSHSMICIDIHAQEMQIVLAKDQLKHAAETVQGNKTLLDGELQIEYQIISMREVEVESTKKMEKETAEHFEYVQYLQSLIAITDKLLAYIEKALKYDYATRLEHLELTEQDFWSAKVDKLPVAEALGSVADNLWESYMQTTETIDMLFWTYNGLKEKREMYSEQSFSEDQWRHNQNSLPRSASPAISYVFPPSSPATSMVLPHAAITSPYTPEAKTGITDYDVIKPISKGSYGRVFLAKKKLTGEYYAIKVLRKQDMVKKNQMSNVTQERTILTQLDSPFVVKLFYSFQTSNNIYLVMEYLNGGDCAVLLKNMSQLDEPWAKQYIAEITLGLEFLHDNGIVHRYTI